MTRNLTRSEACPVVIVVCAVLFFAFLAALFAGCQPRRPAVLQNRPDFIGDASPPPDGPSDDCASSCAAWRGLRCPEANPTPSGVPCEVVCRNAEVNGLDSAKDTSCASRAHDCSALRACPY
jgi:hypothetical protein